MKRSWKSLTVLSLVLLLSLVLTGIASAEVIRGKGWLHAEGAGVAVLRMSGHIKIEGHDTGVIYIYNFDELQVEGRWKATVGAAIYTPAEYCFAATQAPSRLAAIECW
jgi:hypothetical protein